MRKPLHALRIGTFRAFAAVLLFGGSGVVPASGSFFALPVTSSMIGPSNVKPGQTAIYTFVVMFTNGTTKAYPPNNGAVLSAAHGSINFTGAYTAPISGSRDVVTGSFSIYGVTTSASHLVLLQ